MAEKIILNTDGGARGNPGIAGAGAVIATESGEVLKEVSKSLGVGTNNEAEYQGVILGFETLKQVIAEQKLVVAAIEVRVDSELICKQLRGEYKIKEPRLQVLHAELKSVIGDLWPLVAFVHVRREQNQEADRLANEAMDSQSSE
jgi:ribonuclease HI